MPNLSPAGPTDTTRTVARVLLGAFLVVAGTAHLTFARSEFVAQVPAWVPLPTDFVVVASGVVELLLGAGLLGLGRWRVLVGWSVAAFFVAVIPGNLSQYVNGVDGFGLDSDTARLARLFFQPVLVAWALWSTAAWRDRPWAGRHTRTEPSAATPSSEQGSVPTMSTTAIDATITGRVQAVGFRAWARQQAQHLDLAGWIRNEPDGSVQLHVQGPEDAVAEIVAALEDGPRTARVDDVTTTSADIDPDRAGFTVEF